MLLHGYRAWGWDGLLRRIQGMSFAFGLWDRADQVLHLVRDRAGKKPLYYTLDPQGGLCFSSTLDSLLALLPHRPALNPQAIDAYLVYQAVSSPPTPYEGVFQLPPAHEARFEFRTGRLAIAPYWDVSTATSCR